MAFSERKKKLLAQAEFDFNRFLVASPVDDTAATTDLPRTLSAQSEPEPAAGSQHPALKLEDGGVPAVRSAGDCDGGIKLVLTDVVPVANAPLSTGGAATSAAGITDAKPSPDGRPQDGPNVEVPPVGSGTSAAAACQELSSQTLAGGRESALPVSAVVRGSSGDAERRTVAADGCSPTTSESGCVVVLDEEDDVSGKSISSDSDSDSGEVVSSLTSDSSSSSDDVSMDAGPQCVKNPDDTHMLSRNDGETSREAAAKVNLDINVASTGKRETTQSAMTDWRQSRAMSISDDSGDDRPGKSTTAVGIPDSDYCNSDSDSLDEIPSAERKSDKPPKTRGELSLEDMPPLKELQISVPETVAVREVGIINGIVDSLVIIASLRELAPLDMDTILFLDGRKPLGRVFEVFGPVPSPFYSVRFNSPEEIKNKAISIGLKVYYAPSESMLTRYVFVESLKAAKGSDASWKYNNEPPAEALEYSDDDEERQARKGRRRRGRETSECDGTDDAQPLASAETADGTPRSCAITDFAGQGHLRGRRGRGRRGGRGRPFTSPSPGRGTAGVSFIAPGSGAARWGTPAAACWGNPAGASRDGHYWMSPPPFVTSTAASSHSADSVLPAMPAQGLQNDQSQPTLWQSQYQQAQQPSHAGNTTVAWPQVKQEPQDWTDAPSPWAPQVPWYGAQQQNAPAALECSSCVIAAAQSTIANDGTGVCPSTSTGKGCKTGGNRASEVTSVPAAPAPAKLPVIIDTRYVQSSQQTAAGSTASLKPCASWPDYDD